MFVCLLRAKYDIKTSYVNLFLDAGIAKWQSRSKERYSSSSYQLLLKIITLVKESPMILLNTTLKITIQERVVVSVPYLC